MPSRPHAGARLTMGVALVAACVGVACLCGPVTSAAGRTEAQRRVDAVLRVRGLAAFWDFVRREPSGARFAAHQPAGSAHDYSLDVVNYVHDHWGQGRPAAPADVPTLGSGPFGEAVRFLAEPEPTFRPLLMVPRARLHDTPLDVKGPGASVSMVAWVIRESGNHAVAGIWHEGTDLAEAAGVRRPERGMRQYALFAGLAANEGSAAVHLSENGAASFGDRYARNLASTPEIMPAVRLTADSRLDRVRWSVMAFTFDNDRDEVRAYLDGVSTSYWVERPETHPFFKWPAQGWRQAEWHRQPGVQPGEDPAFPIDQWYTPPEDAPRTRVVLDERPDARVEVHEYAYTRVRVTYARGQDGGVGTVVRRELLALRANPFWFGHDLYAPATAAEGGPFTIGRVIHSARGVGFTGAIGGLAVWRRALRPDEVATLSAVAAAGALRLPATDRKRSGRPDSRD